MVTGSDARILKSPRVFTMDELMRLPGSYHGSGCTLASAIAGYLAGGASIDNAVPNAQNYTWQTLANGFRPGRGQFIPDRFFRTRSGGDKAEMRQGGGHGDGR